MKSAFWMLCCALFCFLGFRLREALEARGRWWQCAVVGLPFLVASITCFALGIKDSDDVGLVLGPAACLGVALALRLDTYLESRRSP